MRHRPNVINYKVFVDFPFRPLFVRGSYLVVGGMPISILYVFLLGTSCDRGRTRCFWAMGRFRMRFS